MKLSMGIVGLPNVGKSTLFNVLTKIEVNIANYPFATIDPNIGVVLVPDERLGKLAEISNSKKIVPAVVEFYDIAGLVKGANKGEGLGNQFLTHIREVSAVIQVLRVFKDGNIVHVEGEIDPVRDLDIIKIELILKDLETVDKRLKKAESDAKSGDKESIRIRDELKEVKIELEKENLILGKKTGDLNLLTAKPQIFLLNGKPEDVSEELKNKIKELNADYIIMDLNNPKETSELIKKSYEILDLISFLTTGEDEIRAWTIKRGTKAPEAAGVIHTDFEDKFIKAEIIKWDKLVSIGSWQAAKQKGWIMTEGKDYVMEDGDVMVVKI